jgi:predicted TIM-barrel fold metal-dependent hydrolase
MKAIPTVDGHHHIWRLHDLAWLSGPPVPRIFGPYEAIRRDYTMDEFRSDISSSDVVRSIYVQTNWPAGQSLDEAKWVQSVADATGWPHANVAHVDLAESDVETLLARLVELPLTRGIRQQIHWHANPQYSFAGRPDLMSDPRWRSGLSRLEPHGLLFELQIFTSQMEDGAKLARDFPNITFVLEHAGMLEDRSADGLERWRAGMRALADCSNVNVKLSGLGTFDHAYQLELVAPIIADTVAMFGADRCLYGSNFPIEKLWTDYSSLYRTFRRAIEPLSEIDQQKILNDTATRLYRL